MFLIRPGPLGNPTLLKEGHWGQSKRGRGNSCAIVAQSKCSRSRTIAKTGLIRHQPLFPWKPAEKGKLKLKIETMVLVSAMGRVKGIMALSDRFHRKIGV